MPLYKKRKGGREGKMAPFLFSVSGRERKGAWGEGVAGMGKKKRRRERRCVTTKNQEGGKEKGKGKKAHLSLNFATPR